MHADSDDSPEDLEDTASGELMGEVSEGLPSAVDAALVPWARECILSRAPHLRTEANEAATRCADEVVESLRSLLDLDIDRQRATPLELVRRSTGILTEVLVAEGVPVGESTRRIGGVDDNDPYGLGPASWADLGAEANEAAMRWGAAKAMVHLRRRRGPSS